MPERAARLAAFKAIMAEPLSGVAVSAAVWSALFGLVHLVPVFKARTFGYKVSKQAPQGEEGGLGLVLPN